VTTALVAFGLPYALWALVRAASYHFGAPTLPQSVIHFLFGHWRFLLRLHGVDAVPDLGVGGHARHRGGY
jgi:hypothetical protein